MPLRKWTQTDSARQFAREVADRLCGQIAEDRAPWQKRWDKPTGADLPPFNASNGDRYRGLNEIQLRSVAEQKGFNDPRWMNYRAAMSMGAQVRAGERGTKVEYLRYSTQPETIHRTYTVFNADQIDRMPPLEQHLPKEPQQWEVCERAERLLHNSGAQFKTNNESWAGYAKSRDIIVIPAQEKFRSPEAYYTAVLHEMGHWTGHESRLDRDCLKNRYVNHEYRAQEDLRVQMMCLKVNSELRLPKEYLRSSAYKQDWIETIKINPDDLRSAIRDADRMADYILQYDRQPERSQNVDQIPSAARSVDDLSERKPTSERKPYVVHDDSQADHTEALGNKPKPWLSYPHGASGAFPKPSKDRDDVDLSR
ncbi:MAG: zincin-like metallopeptidase domain-containing protein [Bryobacterales bacterium]|nr:zincin-like metallopeptidase domain-containing protein [Bryobacterales bacterium]